MVRFGVELFMSHQLPLAGSKGLLSEVDEDRNSRFTSLCILCRYNQFQQYFNLFSK